MQVGQHVVCINDRWPVFHRDDRRAGVTYPVKGVVYTIRDIVPSPTGRGGATLLLVEIVNPKVNYRSRGVSIGRFERTFDVERFKPLTKLRVEDFMSATAPLETVQEPA